MKKEGKLVIIIFRCFLVLLGAFFMLDAVFAAQLSNINLGIIMPFVIGLPLLILGVFYPTITKIWNEFRFLLLIKWGMIICYGLFSLLFLTTTMLIKTAASDPIPDNSDALIVLGAGIRGDRPSRILAYRLDKAIEVYDSLGGDVMIIVSGGMGNNEQYAESYVMKNYLVEHGVPADKIIEEDESTSTEENFLLSKALIEKKLGADASLCFVTTEFHVFRAERLAERLGVSAAGIAARDYAPLELNNYLRECAAIVQHFILGKL